MTKLRDPRDFPAAIEAIARELGFAEAGAVVGKTDHLIRKWADPDADQKPSLDQATALDAAMLMRTGRHPIADALLRKLDDIAAEHDAAPVLDRFVGVVASLSDIGTAFRAAVDPSGPGGASITYAELCATLAAIGRATDDLANLRRDVQAAWDRQRRVIPVRKVGER